jgi:hypothetical protein
MLTVATAFISMTGLASGQTRGDTWQSTPLKLSHAILI